MSQNQKLQQKAIRSMKNKPTTAIPKKMLFKKLLHPPALMKGDYKN
jgi:hypothetical protein